MAQNPYSIRGGEVGRNRLRLLADVMRGGTDPLLDRFCMPGMRCLDLGSGGGDVATTMAFRVGVSGSVLGVELDAEKVAMASAEAHALSLMNVAYETADVNAWSPSEPFDLIYARFLLSHLPSRRELLRRAKGWLSPGGVLVLEDIDFRGHRSHPHSAELDTTVGWYERVVAKRGGNAWLGPELPELLVAAGLSEVGVSAWQPVAVKGGVKHLIVATVEAISHAIVEDGLTTEDELGQLLERLRSIADDSTTLMCGPTIFQAWGRRVRDA
ncbi:MAG: hypothetical protein AMXMBFR81_09690 [Chthonomonas sp.]